MNALIGIALVLIPLFALFTYIGVFKFVMPNLAVFMLWREIFAGVLGAVFIALGVLWWFVTPGIVSGACLTSATFLTIAWLFVSGVIDKYNIMRVVTVDLLLLAGLFATYMAAG